MSDITRVLVIGDNDYARKIQSLLLKAAVETALIAGGDGEPFPADLVIEAVAGNHEAKRQALVKHAAAPTTLLATTIAGGVTEVAAATGREDTFVGLHFIFNPFEDRCLVEVVRGLGTSDRAVQGCRGLIDKTGATPVIVADVDGLIIDRTMASVINEAALMYETGLASLEDINRVPKLCLNWPVGPFEFADLIGIDNIVATLDAASKYDTQYLPCRLLRKMVAAGWLGRKTGRGFYEYPQKV